MEYLHHSLHLLPHLLRWLAEFLITKIIFKFIVAHYLSYAFGKWADPWFAKNERRLAIWTHYNLRAQKKGHLARSVVVCVEGKCALI